MGENRCVRVGVAVVVLLLAGCGVPQQLSKQARGELTPRTLKVTGLVVGHLGLLERLGLGAPRSLARLRTEDVIPWTDVIRADRRGVVVRDGAETR
jgi:hypothetical protein